MNKMCTSLLCLLLAHGLWAQPSMSLQQALDATLARSPRVRQAETALQSAHWSYRSFRSNYLPQLSLSTISGSYNRAIDEILQPDGTLAFRSRQVANSSLSLSLSQAVAPTGGTFFVSSSINRIDNFGPDFTQYQTVPASIGFVQPLLAFNSLRWQRRIQPLQYQESQRLYQEEVEEALLTTIDRFFTVLNAQVNLEIAELNAANNDTLYAIAKGRYSLGKIAENELLQMELALMNARQQVSQSQLDLQTSTLQLRLHLGENDYVPMQLLVPSDSLPTSMTAAEAIAHAKENRADVLGFERRQLQAQQQVAQAVGETGITGQVQANLGLNQQGSTLADAYTNALDQQLVQVRLSAPIIDWGRAASRRRSAQAQAQLQQLIIDQESQSFDQAITVAVNNLKMTQYQLQIARQSNRIAALRYEITKQRYLIGKIGITDLNIAQQEKDQGKQNLTAALRSYFSSYYRLRRLTLWDWQQQQPVAHPLPGL